jgi:hypothetical protein
LDQSRVLLSLAEAINGLIPLPIVVKEVLVMVGENKRTVFENWLAAYGSHLEEIAGTRISRSQEDQNSREICETDGKQKQSH